MYMFYSGICGLMQRGPKSLSEPLSAKAANIGATMVYYIRTVLHKYTGKSSLETLLFVLLGVTVKTILT